MQVLWTQNARNSYHQIIDFLLVSWEVKIAVDFEFRISKILAKITENRNLCPKTGYMGLRKCVIHKNASLIYVVKNDEIFIVDIIDNRQNARYFEE